VYEKANTSALASLIGGSDLKSSKMQVRRSGYLVKGNTHETFQNAMSLENLKDMDPELPLIHFSILPKYPGNE